MEGNLAILEGNFDWFLGKSTFFFPAMAISVDKILYYRPNYAHAAQRRHFVSERSGQKGLSLGWFFFLLSQYWLCNGVKLRMRSSVNIKMLMRAWIVSLTLRTIDIVNIHSLFDSVADAVFNYHPCAVDLRLPNRTFYRRRMRVNTM